MAATTRIFLPGAGGSASFWKPVADRLPADWPKILLSWPGLGNEPPDPGVNSIDDLVGLVSARIDASDGPVDLIGQSMGGLITIRTALRHPGRIRRIVLTGTSGGVDVAVTDALLVDAEEAAAGGVVPLLRARLAVQQTLDLLGGEPVALEEQRVDA